MAENFISKLLAGTLVGRIHDSSALHGIAPAPGADSSSFIVRIGNPESGLTSTFSLYVPAGVALKSDILAVMNYRGYVDGMTGEHGITGKTPTAGDVYVASQAFTYTAVSPEVAIEAGDMFVGNGTSWDIIQTNIDPSKYSAKGHTHTVTVSGNTGNTSFTPAGTISVAVAGTTSTFTGSYTPQGTISITTIGYTSTKATITNNLAVSGGAHSHSFTGTAATISISYDKADATTGQSEAQAVTGEITVTHTLTPKVSATLSSASATGAVTITDHSHTFIGSATTFTGSYTPEGTVSKPGVTASLEKISNKKLVDGVSVSSASISVTGSTDNVCTTASYTTASELLNLTWAAANVTASTSNKYVTTVSLTSASFTYATGNISSIGLDADITFTGKAATVSVSGTPAGTISNATGLTGTATYHKITGINATVSVTGTPSVTFSLTAAAHTHGITYTTTSTSTSYTPAGTIGSTTPTGYTVSGTITVSYDKATSAGGAFNGTAATITVTGTPALTTPTGTFYGKSASHSHSFSVTTTSGTDA